MTESVIVVSRFRQEFNKKVKKSYNCVCKFELNQMILYDQTSKSPKQIKTKKLQQKNIYLISEKYLNSNSNTT